MDNLNYHHLFYFWTVGREGSVARACDLLEVSQPTISTQLALLEKALGEKLFVRTGRNLVLSDAGRLVFGYADQIFNTGRELQQALHGRSTGPRNKLAIGIADVLPKTLVHRIIDPVTKLEEPPAIVCQEDKPDRLLAELVQHNIDLVLTDALPGHNVKARAHGHLLGESSVTFFASPKLVHSLDSEFPQCLDGCPILLPTRNTTLRRSLDDWFESLRITPRIVGEFSDAALMKSFGQHGLGVFPAPQAVQAEVIEQFRVKTIGCADKVRERVYALTIDRMPKNSSVVALIESARKRVFGGRYSQPSSD